MTTGLCALAISGLVLTGCGDDTSDDAAAPPPCAGTATSDYGLGNAIHAAAPRLAALPTRVSTGTATVISVDGAKAPLRVAITVCGNNLDDAALFDVASTLAREVATGQSLGSQVGSVTIELQPKGTVTQSSPFAVENFTSDAELSTLRSNWKIATN